MGGVLFVCHFFKFFTFLFDFWLGRAMTLIANVKLHVSPKWRRTHVLMYTVWQYTWFFFLFFFFFQFLNFYMYWQIDNIINRLIEWELKNDIDNIINTKSESVKWIFYILYIVLFCAMQTNEVIINVKKTWRIYIRKWKLFVTTFEKWYYNLIV